MTSVLVQAIQDGDLETIKTLLDIDGISNEHNLLPNKININDSIIGWSPLHYAVANNKIEVVKFLIANGADIEFKDITGWTPLHRAACDNNVDIVKVLLVAHNTSKQSSLSKESYIDIKTNHGLTPLNYAIANNKLEMAEFLIANGADVNAVNDSGWNALHRAISDDKSKIVDIAGHHQLVSLVKFLLLHGADREAKDHIGKRPIDYAKSKEIIELLETWQDLLEIKEPNME